MIVQIYEIQTPREADKCIQLGVDHMGSVLQSEERWKDPQLQQVFRLTENTPTLNSLIPLFQDIQTISSALDYYRPHFVHFCETLTDEQGQMVDLKNLIDRQIQIKNRFPEIKIIRSIPIPENGNIRNFPTLQIAARLEKISDLFLTDTWLGQEPVAGYIGITGKTVDFELAKKLITQSKIPVILAGGLSPENVLDALVKTRPFGADSCTQTNQLDQNMKPIRFKKDFTRVKMFVQEVRKAHK